MRAWERALVGPSSTTSPCWHEPGILETSKRTRSSFICFGEAHKVKTKKKLFSINENCNFVIKKCPGCGGRWAGTHNAINLFQIAQPKLTPPLIIHPTITNWELSKPSTVLGMLGNISEWNRFLPSRRLHSSGGGATINISQLCHARRWLVQLKTTWSRERGLGVSEVRWRMHC